MTTRTLHREIVLPRPREEVFAFFADAGNLERLTPPWLRFAIATPRPIGMEAGRRIDYRLRVHGLPLRWTSEITAWEPPVRFVDEQIRGPYRTWIHEHTFEETPGGTLVRDLVRYAAPVRRAVDLLFVRPDLRRIFDYRHARLAEIFRKGSSGEAS